MIEEAENFAKNQGYNTILLGAQSTAETFYEKLGYTAYGDPFEDAGMPHIYMKRLYKNLFRKSKKQQAFEKNLSLAYCSFCVYLRDNCL